MVSVGDAREKGGMEERGMDAEMREPDGRRRAGKVPKGGVMGVRSGR